MRRAFAALLMLAVAVSLRASDAAPTQAAPADDSIAAAKVELEALKTATANGAVPGSAVPHISIPEVHAEPEVLPAPKPQTQADATSLEAKTASKSANWLVDAMMNPKGDPTKDPKNHQRDLPGTRTARDDFLLNAADAKSRPDSKSGSEENASATDETTRPTTAPPVNPLNQFMAEWMSPSDYSILRRTVETPTAGGSAGSTLLSAPIPAADGDFGNALAALGLDSIAPSKSADVVGKPADNPYLQLLNSPSAELPSPPPSAPAIVPTLPPIPPPAAIEPPSSKPNVPDFVKPSDDDKYFKPLKRF